MPSKSQLVIEYGYRVREQCPDTWVSWIFAGSPARFEQDFRKIADLVQIPGRDNPQANILALVHDWLHDVGNGKWLVIIDNADDDQIFLKSGDASQERQASGPQDQISQPLSWYLPQTHNGRILMTTRYRDVALKLVEHRDIITIEPMDESDALELLEKKIEGLTDRDSDGTRKKLVAALEYMPLAIVQAASYIYHRALSRPVQRYLVKFRKSDRKRIKLLERKGGHLRRDWEAKNSILVTWQISFDHLCRIRQTAADRLSLMSFFDRQGIPQSLVREQTRVSIALSSTAGKYEDSPGESTSENASESSEDDDFEEDMVTLRDYSFITFSREESFEMHSLVQLATRDWLANEGKLDAFRWQFFKLLTRALPAVGIVNSNSNHFHILYPHVKAALSQKDEAEVRPNGAQALRDFATVMHSAGRYARFSTFYMYDVKNLFKTAMEVRIKILGMKNMDTLINKIDTMSSMEELAKTYSMQGQSEKAKELGLDVIKWSESEFGLKHMNTLHHMECLADIYQEEDDLYQAQRILLQVIEAMREMDAPFDRTLPLLSLVAMLRRAQGNLELAFTLQELAVKNAEEVFGPADHHTLDHMDRMAEILQDLGRLDEAVDMQTQVVEETERISGTQHYGAFMARYRLYCLFHDKGLVGKGLTVGAARRGPTSVQRTGDPAAGRREVIQILSIMLKV